MVDTKVCAMCIEELPLQKANFNGKDVMLCKLCFRANKHGAVRLPYVSTPGIGHTRPLTLDDIEKNCK